MKGRTDRKILSTARLFTTLLSLAAVIPIAASSEIDFVIEGDLLVTTVKGYNDGAYRFCGELPWEFQYALQSHAGYELTDDEFTALVGEAAGFGIRGINSLYSRAQRKIVPWATENDLAKTYNSNEYDNYPIVCGATEEARAQAGPKNGEQPDPNSPASQYAKGLAYTNGDGVLRDTVLAREWFGKAAEQGHAAAQTALGLLYHRGSGGPEDFYLAQLWYLKAARQGDADAQANLGGMYWNGDGVQVDHERSYAWFSMAAKQGHAIAGNFIDNVTSNLDAAALERAQALAMSYEDPVTINAIITRLSAPDRSLFSQCLVNEADGGEPQLRKWCSCLSDEFEVALTPADFRLFGQDYPAFRAKLVADPDNGGDWTFTNVLNSCRSCKESDYIGCLPEDREPPSRESFTRTLDLLSERNFDAIPENRVYRRFYLEYISAYSNYCAHEIRQGKKFTTRHIRVNGLDVSVTEFETVVETGYITSFNNYEWYAEREYPGELVTAMRSTEERDSYLENIFGATAVLDEHFSNGCSSNEVRTLYRALYDFERLGDDE